MKYLSILFFLSIICFSHQKINTGIYEIDINSDQVDCELRISSDLTYEICLSYQATEDIVNVAVLSFGHYSTSDEQLFLHDDYFNYDWVVFIKDNVISVGHGYSFLNGRDVLQYHDEIVKIVPPDNVYLGRIKAQVDRFFDQQDYQQIVAGQYEDQNHDNALIIKNDGKYELYLKDVLLSEGDWSQQDNLLVLHDIQLNHNFTFAIGNRSLLSLGIPADFGGTLYTLIKTKTSISTQETKIPPKNRRGGCSRIKSIVHYFFDY